MPCVLIVEDDDDVRDFMKVLLEGSGYSTMTAANGLEAFERIEEQRPCAILLDVHMPIMDGYQFRAQQLRDPRLARIPGLCISAVFNPHEVMRRTGVERLSKPAAIDVLMKHVEQMCRGAVPQTS